MKEPYRTTMTGLENTGLIEFCCEQIRERWNEWEAARVDRSRSRMDASTNRRIGTLLVLGKLLADRSGERHQDEGTLLRIAIMYYEWWKEQQ